MPAPPIPPHLTNRPTWHGMVVPWVAAWSSERRYKLRPDHRISRMIHTPHMAIYTYGKQGVGQPELGLMHVPRQRDCILEKLCQVCGRAIDGNPITYTWDNQFAYLEGETRMLCLEPWVCRLCAQYAVRTCPAVHSAHRYRVLETYEVIRSTPVAVTIDPEPFINDLTVGERRDARHFPIIGFVKYALMDFKTLDV